MAGGQHVCSVTGGVTLPLSTLLEVNEEGRKHGNRGRMRHSSPRVQSLTE